MKRFLTGFAALWLVAGCVTVTPAPTPTLPASPQPTVRPTSTASGPTSQPSGQPTPQTSGQPPSAELTAEIDAVTGAVPAIRELQPTRDVPFEVITREQFQQNAEELFNSGSTPDERAAEERLYKRLGLLPADADMDALILQLYGSQVAAYYNPDDGMFHIIQRDSPFNATDKIVVAHEYTHALQDQHFDLKNNTITDNSQGDAQLAQLAVIEGDATLTSQLWAQDNLSFEEMLQMLIDGFSELDQSSLDGIPLVLRRQLEFPYTEGFEFATALHDQGGYNAINDAITTPPASTEQILHPDKYFAHEAPVTVNCTELVAEGWTLAYQQTLGELGIQILAAGGETPDVDIPGFPADWPHADVAAGWGGDCLRMYEAPDGTWVINWETAWDTEADAIAFRARMDELSGRFAGETSLQINDKTVLLHILGSG